MNINNINPVQSHNAFTNTSVINQPKNKSDDTILRTDSLEISEEGKKLLENEEISVTSGKEKLNISKAKDGKSFNIRFEDSAAVLRIVDNGYISINGKKIMLSEDDKKKLIETDKIAAAQRLAAFEKSSMEHNMKVAKKQAAIWELYFKEEAEVQESLMKLMAGDDLNPTELKKILEKDPQGYMRAMMLRSTKQQNENAKHHSYMKNNNEDEHTKQLRKIAYSSTSLQDTEWIGYNTSLNISLEGKEPAIGEISVGQRVIFEGKK